LFDGAEAATTNPISGTLIAFSFAVTLPVLQLGIMIGLVLGLSGGALAAFRAIRLSIPDAIAGGR
jgi:hypothetical protein